MELAASGYRVEQVEPTPGPVTVVVSRLIKPGYEAECEQWLHGIHAVARRFPGHEGLTVIRPRPGQPREYLIILRFANQACLEQWNASPERQAWLAQAERFMQHRPIEHQLHGFETWFSLPSQPSRNAPPRWKMWLLAAGAIYLLQLVISSTIGPLLAAWPLPLRTLVMAPIVSALMTWIALPWLTTRFAGWLYAEKRSVHEAGKQ
jgi:hypothetical protein